MAEQHVIECHAVAVNDLLYDLEVFAEDRGLVIQRGCQHGLVRGLGGWVLLQRPLGPLRGSRRLSKTMDDKDYQEALDTFWSVLGFATAILALLYLFPFLL